MNSSESRSFSQIKTHFGCAYNRMEGFRAQGPCSTEAQSTESSQPIKRVVYPLFTKEIQRIGMVHSSPFSNQQGGAKRRHYQAEIRAKKDEIREAKQRRRTEGEDAQQDVDRLYAELNDLKVVTLFTLLTFLLSNKAWNQKTNSKNSDALYVLNVVYCENAV